MDFFLVTTDHLTERLLFRDDDDFKQAMNYVAITSVTANVPVLAFILMSNHVHFVLQCPRIKAKVFIDMFKRLYGKYICQKCMVNDYLRHLPADIRELHVEDESLHRGIAYVQCNSVAANITPHASLYEWGTGATFFRVGEAEGKQLQEISGREQIRILRSKVKLPGEWCLSNKGYILPESYIAVNYVERLFRSSSRYSFFLNNSSKSRIRMDNNPAPSFRDQSIIAAASDLSRSLFRADSIEQLSEEDLSELMKQLRRRFSADIKQLARVTGFSYSEVTKYLQMF